MFSSYFLPVLECEILGDNDDVLTDLRTLFVVNNPICLFFEGTGVSGLESQLLSLSCCRPTTFGQ